MSSLKEVNFTQPELSPHGVFFVLLLESRNYIAETEIIAERVFFFLYPRYAIAVKSWEICPFVCQESQNEVLTQEASCFNDLYKQLEFCLK